MPSFGGGLNTFVGAFMAGYQMVESPDEKKAREAETRSKTAKAAVDEATAAEYADPEATALRKEKRSLEVQGMRTDNAYKSASIANMGSDNALQSRRLALDESRIAADNRLNTAQAEKLELGNEKEVNKKALIQQNMDRMMQRIKGTGGALSPGAPTPSAGVGPQSAISIEGVSGTTPAINAPVMGVATDAVRPTAIPAMRVADAEAPTGAIPTLNAEAITSREVASQGGELRNVLSTAREAITPIAGVTSEVTMGSVTKDFADLGHEAAKQGMMYAQSALGADKDEAVPTPEGNPGITKFLRGEGAADTKDVEKGKALVNKMGGGNLSPAEQSQYLLSATWQYHMNAGEPEEAKKTAASLMQHYQVMSSQYLSVAQAAASKGDLDGAAEAAVRAYGNIPDGNDLSITKKGGKYELQVKDIDTGEVTVKELLPPEELMSTIMGVSPANFSSFIVDAAGARNEKRQNSPAYSAAMSGGAVDMGGMSPDEANTYMRYKNDKGGGKGGRGSDKNYSEFAGTYATTEDGVLDPESATGWRGAIQKVALSGAVDKRTGKVDTSKVTAWAKLSEDTNHRDAIEATGAHIINELGYGKAPELVAEFLINSTMMPSEKPPITTEDMKRGYKVYKGSRIPIDEEVSSAVNILNEQARRDAQKAAAAEETKRRRPSGIPMLKEDQPYLGSAL